MLRNPAVFFFSEKLQQLGKIIVVPRHGIMQYASSLPFFCKKKENACSLLDTLNIKRSCLISRQITDWMWRENLLETGANPPKTLFGSYS